MIFNTHKLETLVGKRVFGIFLNDWYTVREVSKEYYEEYSSAKEKVKSKRVKKIKTNPIVRSYFKDFQKYGIIERAKIKRNFERESKKGEFHIYPSVQPRYRINLPRLVYDYIEFKKDDFIYPPFKKWPKRKIQNELDVLFGDEDIRRFFVEIFNDLRSVAVSIQKFVEIYAVLYMLPKRNIKGHYFEKLRELSDKLPHFNNLVINLEDSYTKKLAIAIYDTTWPLLLEHPIVDKFIEKAKKTSRRKWKPILKAIKAHKK